MPEYKAISIGKWRCTPTPAGEHILGYWGPHNFVSAGWMYEQRRGKGWLKWMSLTPMESESHMPHIAAAHGTVVVAGLGMGFVLHNILCKPEVTRVIVLEKDKDVVKLFKRTIRRDHWLPALDKFELRLGDALAFRPDFHVDFLYVDLWPCLGEECACSITQTLQCNIQAASVGFWGQEFDFVSWLMAKNLPEPLEDHCTQHHYRAFCEDVGWPLVEQDNPSYPKLALAAVLFQGSIGVGRTDEGVLMAAIAFSASPPRLSCRRSQL